jgi:cytochrome d ubiquinol oxidase subunit I
LCFDVMVIIGFAVLALGLWLLFGRWHAYRDGKPGITWLRGLLVCAAVAGPASVVALECGWVVTEEGRQPWIVVGIMSVRDAVNPEPGLLAGLWLILAVYTGMTVGTVYVLRRLARQHPVPSAPQESDVREYPVT